MLKRPMLGNPEGTVGYVFNSYIDFDNKNGVGLQIIELCVAEMTVAGADDAFFDDDESGHANADPNQLLGAAGCAQLHDGSYDIGHHRLASRGKRRGALDFLQHLSAAVDGRRAEVCAPQIDSNRIFSHAHA